MNENENKSLAVPTDEKTTVEIVPFGTDERIKLNVGIIQKMIAVPTRSGKIPDVAQCIKFIMLCKARHLNPFEGDAYLIGYDTQSGPQFSIITAHQVFLKRAEASEGFDGMESGVIVKTTNGVEEREGDITFDGEELMGGWAKVYRKDRGRPFYRRIKLDTFNTNQSRWSKDPAGMIVKCAEGDALRSAFPTHLGGLYIAEERPPIDVSPTTIARPIIGRTTSGTIVTAYPLEPHATEPKKRGRKPKVKEEVEEIGSATEVKKRLDAAKYTNDQFVELAREKGWIDKDTTFYNIGEEKMKAILENWDVVMSEMDKALAPVETPKENVPEDKLFA